MLVSGKSSNLDVTTNLQAFALLVTAEPYYAVRKCQPPEKTARLRSFA
jgi:hypothetical protein